MAEPTPDFLPKILLLLVLNTYLTFAQVSQQLVAQNPCLSKPTCHECIQTESCAWCYDPNYGDKPRCFQPASGNIVNEEQCLEQYTFNPDNIMSIVQRKALTRAKGLSGGFYNIDGSWNYSQSSNVTGYGENGRLLPCQIVQVTPQRINLQLRARQAYTISMSYTQAEDYPVDLYYLMDLSRSMYDDKEKLSSLGDKLAKTMQNITSNFMLGFGSFVDKVVMPYVSTLPENLAQPCPGCAPPYGFRNKMKLSPNTDRFSKMVKEAHVSGNLDAPEGGFDAIMQAVVCREHIGWREKARRLLVFSTDAGFHYAGDGKLGGIVKPNDGDCHLDDFGYYDKSSEQDYPSVAQINAKVKKNSINVIFAVTADQISVYDQLKTHIEGASSAKLSTDSSNIVELIKEQYEKISSTVELKHNASQYVNIKFFSKCLKPSGELINTNKCGDIKVGDLIEFKIQIEVVKCPTNPDEWKETIQIYPIGINESLIIDLTMLCSCPCERPGHPAYKVNAPECSGQGIYKCGICECQYGAFGRHCECIDANHTVTEANACIQPGSASGQECSGKGNCICGRCECETRVSEHERIYGDYCECDNFNCERHNGLLCSGNGYCDCGKCRCNEGWNSSNCACPTTTHTCFNPQIIGGEICSGHGHCECGACKCNVTDDIRYSGKYCERCPTCPDRCNELKACVQCQQYKTGPFSEEECSMNCTEFTPTSEDVIKADEEKNEILCSFYDEDDCRYTFAYYTKPDGKAVVRVQKERECPMKVFLVGIILGVVAAIVLMGLAIVLLWKLFTTIHDRREFAKFEKERMMAKWDTGENPIYKQATSTFKNPTYAGKS